MTALCERFEVSRKTGYKWLKRWRELGKPGLEDQSRRPTHSPKRACAEIEQVVVELRKKHDAWGGRTLRKRLLDLGHPEVPTPSTITRILHRHGLISPDDSQQHTAWKSFQRDEPNELWQMDFKGDFQLTSSKRCYPLTILDDHSRYALGIVACDNQKRVTVKDHLREAFSRYGIPRAIYVDNGNPWGNANGHTRHSRMSCWLMRHDIEVIHGRPHHPQGRGKIERFHRTLKREVLQDRQLTSLAEAQAAFDPWRTVYNHERPHHALELEVPASRYRMSQRSFKEVTTPFEYSENFEVRKINQRSSEFSFHGTDYRISEAFLDQKIGLSPTDKDGLWDIYFCRFRVAQLDQTTDRITYDRRLVRSRSARPDQAAESGKSGSKS